MANLQVKNVPDEIHRDLRRAAERRGCSVRDLVLEAVRQRLQRERFVERLHRRKPVDLGGPAAALLDDARRERQRR
jgi:plasmid stability protein